MAEFHIHVDAARISHEFEEFLVELGFWRTDFEGGPEDGQTFEPANHLTLKPTTAEQFKDVFDRVMAFAEEHRPMVGYIEGEVVPLDRDIEARPFDDSVPIPFKVELASLLPGQFRETEVHITLNRDRSNPSLLEALDRMGLFSAWTPKAYGIAQIFTVQGSREHIDAILPPLLKYLDDAGGAVNCSIKEELIARWWISSRDLPLPPVVSDVIWRPELCRNTR